MASSFFLDFFFLDVRPLCKLFAAACGSGSLKGLVDLEDLGSQYVRE